MSEYILEIGSGELPYSEVKAIPLFLKKSFEDFFEGGLGLSRKPVILAYSTPKRIFVLIKDLPGKTDGREEEILGPPVAISYHDGRPAVPLLQFMKKNGVENIKKIYTVNQKKGAYTAYRKIIKEVLLKNIIKEKVPEIIKNIPFKKSMFWMDRDIRYPRPVLWILSVFDGKPLPFKYGNIKASDSTRIFGQGKILIEKIESGENYFRLLSKKGIVLKNEARKDFIEKEIGRLSKSIGSFVPEYDDEFMDEIVGLTETPYPVLCDFEEKFLSIPEEILSVVMKKHQRFFPLRNKKGMASSFIGVADSNTKALNPKNLAVLNKNIRYGYTRVLRARLSDADFFFTEDKKKPLSYFTERTKGIMFYEGLGSYYDKTERIQETGIFIAGRLNFGQEIIDDCKKASSLLKFDLGTHVVYEFPEMQGVMGRIYAKHAGENEPVSRAVEEHYCPVSMGGKRILPSSDLSALCALSDKLDTVFSFVMLKKLPTGEADPFYLRRAMIGIIEIILNRKYIIKLEEIFDHYFENIIKTGHNFGFSEKLCLSRKDELKPLFENFAVTRFKNHLLSEGYRPDEISSILEDGAGLDFYSLKLRIDFVSRYRIHEEFFELAQAYKRIRNITINFPELVYYDIEKLTLKEELSLENKYAEIKDTALAFVHKGDYLKAMNLLYRLKEPVNLFFDKVLIMAEDKDLRNSRLGLLNNILLLLKNICDFSALSY